MLTPKTAQRQRRRTVAVHPRVPLLTDDDGSALRTDRGAHRSAYSPVGLVGFRDFQLPLLRFDGAFFSMVITLVVCVPDVDSPQPEPPVTIAAIAAMPIA